MNVMPNSRIDWSGIIFICLVLIGWEIAAQAADGFYFPKATGVAITSFGDWRNISVATGARLRRTAIGFGIVPGRIRPLGEIVEPVLEFLRPLPAIAVVPLAMTVLGIGDTAKLVVIVFGPACRRL